MAAKSLAPFFPIDFSIYRKSYLKDLGDCIRNEFGVCGLRLHGIAKLCGCEPIKRYDKVFINKRTIV